MVAVLPEPQESTQSWLTRVPSSAFSRFSWKVLQPSSVKQPGSWLAPFTRSDGSSARMLFAVRSGDFADAAALRSA